MHDDLKNEHFRTVHEKVGRHIFPCPCAESKNFAHERLCKNISFHIKAEGIENNKRGRGTIAPLALTYTPTIFNANTAFFFICKFFFRNSCNKRNLFFSHLHVKKNTQVES